MKKSQFVLLIIITFFIGLAGCSKHNTDKIVGRWSVDSLNDANNPNFKVEIVYEFTKDKLIMEGNIHGEALPSVEASYQIVSDEGGVLTLEATHPDTKQKGIFKIKIDGIKMNLTDPDNRVFNLTKQQ
jgi:hypothetical protein